MSAPSDVGWHRKDTSGYRLLPAFGRFLPVTKGSNRPKADVEGELLRMVAKTIYAAKVSTLAS